MLRWFLHKLRARKPKTNGVPQASLNVECLEDRLTPSWTGIPPTTIVLPAAIPVTLNSQSSSNGEAAITRNEVDYYRFTAPTTGTYTLSATRTSGSSLDSVIGLFSASGARLAYNDDISATNLNSRTTATLTAGRTYYLGVTNYTGSRGGDYYWAITGPTPTTSPTAPTAPTTTTPSSGGFHIQLNITGMTSSEVAIFQQAAARWEQIITGDLPDATYNGHVVDDLEIDASAAPIDGPGGILGQAGPDAFRAGSDLPIHGSMQFDTADLAQLEASGQLQQVIIHEMGHVLGIGIIWQARGLLSGAGTSNPLFIGPQATAQYNAIFHTNAAGVPVENSGGPGTQDAHWRESVLGNELMTGYLNSGFNPLSRITVASLADLGYQVNLNAADPYSPPT
jgi:hypothetical protein